LKLFYGTAARRQLEQQGLALDPNIIRQNQPKKGRRKGRRHASTTAATNQTSTPKKRSHRSRNSINKCKAGQVSPKNDDAGFAVDADTDGRYEEDDEQYGHGQQGMNSDDAFDDAAGHIRQVQVNTFAPNPDQFEDLDSWYNNSSLHNENNTYDSQYPSTMRRQSRINNTNYQAIDTIENNGYNGIPPLISYRTSRSANNGTVPTSFAANINHISPTVSNGMADNGPFNYGYTGTNHHNNLPFGSTGYYNAGNTHGDYMDQDHTQNSIYNSNGYSLGRNTSNPNSY
jgi:hypothetical protein